MTLSRPRTTGRVLRGSALGLGLLVAGGVTAPAAFAVVDATATPTEVPVEGTVDPASLQDTPQPAVDLADSMDSLVGDFGAGKDFTVQVAPQNAYPADLDLSGAVFAATPVAGGDAVTCTTDEAGRCRFVAAEPTGDDTEDDDVERAVAQRADATLPTGQYVLTQQSTTAGLSLATGSTPFTLCDQPGVHVPLGATVEDEDELDFGICAPSGLAGVDVQVDSLFRTSLITTVLDEDTEEPVAGVGFELTAPDYPRRTATVPSPVLDLAGDPLPPVEYTEQISGPDGSLTFGGTGSWFLPGAGYTLTPTATVPQGYATPSTYAFAIATTPTQSALGTPVAITRLLGSGLAAGSQPVVPDQGGVAAGSSAPAAAATTSGSGPAATATTASAGTTAAALATTGSPVGTMVLLGGGLVALGGTALVAGSTLRRRARRSA